MADKELPVYVREGDQVNRATVDAEDNTKNNLNKAPADNMSQRGHVDHWGVKEKRENTAPHFPEDNPPSHVTLSPEARHLQEMAERRTEWDKTHEPEKLETKEETPVLEEKEEEL